MELHVSMRQESPDRWVAEAKGDVPLRAAGPSREACLADMRHAIEAAFPEPAGAERLVVIVDAVPKLAGVAEAAEVMGWDKRRIITYIDRGRFPPPIEWLASGRLWRRSDVEDFARAWQARRSTRRASRTP